jgi:hypothetical protein
VRGSHVVKRNALNHMRDSQSEDKANNLSFHYSVNLSAAV